jgi:type VI secretion system secreted protein Hcp
MALVDYFLKLDGIQGESPDKTHKNEIEIESFSWGATQTGTARAGGGMGAGKVQMQDFHFVKRIDKASPKLMLVCANGDHIKSAVLVCRKAGKEQQEYLKITFSDLLVSSYQTSGSGGADVLPMDQISLNFSKVEYEYKEQKADGTLGGAIKAYYDLKQNVGG